jgi:hypothetical protein
MTRGFAAVALVVWVLAACGSSGEEGAPGPGPGPGDLQDLGDPRDPATPRPSPSGSASPAPTATPAATPPLGGAGEPCPRLAVAECVDDETLRICAPDLRWEVVPCPDCRDAICHTPRVTPTPVPTGGPRPTPLDICATTDVLGHWNGHFDGRVAWRLLGTAVSGSVSFDLTCGGDKILLAGRMQGEGNGVPFRVDLEGIYNPATRGLEGRLVRGEVMFNVGTVNFEGTLTGRHDANRFVDGRWSGMSTNITADGSGTWLAERSP